MLATPYAREVGHLAKNSPDGDDGVSPLAPDYAARDHEQLAPHQWGEVEHDQTQNSQNPAILDFAELLDDGRKVSDNLPLALPHSTQLQVPGLR